MSEAEISIDDVAPALQSALAHAGLSGTALLAGTAASIIGAKVVLSHSFLRRDSLEVREKPFHGNTLVTAADLQSSAATTHVIRSFFPEHMIIEEETGASGRGSSAWYVDPLDGTTNFVRGIKSVAIGVALYEDNTPIVAAICQPYSRALLFSASGGGSFIVNLNENLDIEGNPVRLVVSSSQGLHRSLGIVDGSFNSSVSKYKLSFMNNLFSLSGGRIGLRSYGSNIDHQMHVAMGAADFAVADTLSGFFDIAAGALIVPEAGGRATDLEGESLSPESQVAIFSNRDLHEKVLSAAREAYSGFSGFIARS